MRLYSFRTCEDNDGFIAGIQFMMSESNYFEHPEDEELFAMDPLGDMSGTKCKTLRLGGEIEKIEASYTEKNGVAGLRFYKDGKYKSFGKAGDKKAIWELDESEPLVGVYGDHDDDKITSLGFISLDMQCQAAANANAGENTSTGNDEVIDKFEPLVQKSNLNVET